MILVDTSVWIDFFQNPSSQHSARLESLIRPNNQVCICGLILQELLQGVKEERNSKLLRDRMIQFPFLNTNRETYILAADLFKRMKRKGLTVRTADATIAAVAIQNGISIYTLDTKHFEAMKRLAGLKLV